VRPLTRLIVGLIAIPLFRLFRRRVIRVQDLNEELEKDVDQWFRGSILLLIATAYMEPQIFFWVENTPGFHDPRDWVTLGLRLMLAIGVIEGMPDQTLFALIHPGMSRIKFQKGLGFFRNLKQQRRNILLGALCHHLNRSSPVFAILSTLIPGRVGLVFYAIAITQYLIIGLVTSRDRAKDVLNEFDRRVAERRQELIEELDLTGQGPKPDSIQTSDVRCDDGAVSVEPPVNVELPQ
jgi:hypothetical protein